MRNGDITGKGKLTKTHCAATFFAAIYKKIFSFSMTNLQEKTDITSFTPFEGSWIRGVYFLNFIHKT